MALFIHLQQLSRVDVGVPLRGAQTRVAEQFLNGTQIGAALEQMRRERMPERVRADSHPLARRRDVLAADAIDAARSQPSAAKVHEQRISVRSTDPTYLTYATGVAH